MKLFSESHKTVFVVDHCPYMAESCRQHVEFDMLTKNRTQGIIPLAPISKSLWTCAVEASVEYCRIMYDIFPFKKLVRVQLPLLFTVFTAVSSVPNVHSSSVVDQ